ncbi:hypothetical protein FRC17_000486 [Serendipita sp. 399]|nr:hypothetical protein FRC17_000486 [Serendipita sp. 399]
MEEVAHAPPTAEASQPAENVETRILTPQELEEGFNSQLSEIGTVAEEAYKSMSSKIQDFLQTFRTSLRQKHERDEAMLTDQRTHMAAQQAQIDWLNKILKERDALVIKIGDDRTQAKKALEVQVSLTKAADRDLKERDSKIETLENEINRLEGVDGRLDAEILSRRKLERDVEVRDGRIERQLARIRNLQDTQTTLNKNLQSTQSSVDSLKQQLSENQKALEERRKQLEECRKELEERSTQLTWRSKLLEERNAQLQERDTQLEEQNRELQNDKEQLSSAQSLIEKLQADHAFSMSRYKQDLDTLLTQATSKIDSLENRINRITAEKAALDKAIKVDKESINRLENDNGDLNCKVAEAKEQLEKRQSTVEALQSKCQTLQARITDLEATSNINKLQSEAEKAHLMTKLSESDGQIISLRKEIEQLNGNVARHSKLVEGSEAKAKKLSAELHGLKEQLRKSSTEARLSQQRDQLRASAALFALKQRKMQTEASLKESQKKLEEVEEQKRTDSTLMKAVSEKLDAANANLSTKEEELKAALERVEELRASYEAASKRADEMHSLLHPEPCDPITGPLLLPYSITRMESGPISVHIGSNDSEVRRQFDQYKEKADREIQALSERLERVNQSVVNQDQVFSQLMEMEGKYNKAEKQLRDAVEENIELRGKIEGCDDVERALKATRDILKGVEGRLREAVVENTDLRRKSHKW